MVRSRKKNYIAYWYANRAEEAYHSYTMFMNSCIAIKEHFEPMVEFSVVNLSDPVNVLASDSLNVHCSLTSILDALKALKAKALEAKSDKSDELMMNQRMLMLTLETREHRAVSVPLVALIHHFPAMFKDDTTKEGDRHLPWGYLVVHEISSMFKYQENLDDDGMDAFASNRGGLLRVCDSHPLAAHAAMTPAEMQDFVASQRQDAPSTGENSDGEDCHVLDSDGEDSDEEPPIVNVTEVKYTIARARDELQAAAEVPCVVHVKHLKRALEVLDTVVAQTEEQSRKKSRKKLRRADGEADEKKDDDQTEQVDLAAAPAAASAEAAPEA